MTTDSNDVETPRPPVYPQLLIEYDADLDILTLWDGTPASDGNHISDELVVFSDGEDDDSLAHIVTLEGAAKLLRPYLFPGDQ